VLGKWRRLRLGLGEIEADRDRDGWHAELYRHDRRADRTGTDHVGAEVLAEIGARHHDVRPLRGEHLRQPIGRAVGRTAVHRPGAVPVVLDGDLAEREAYAAAALLRERRNHRDLETGPFQRRAQDHEAGRLVAVIVGQHARAGARCRPRPARTR
jgi:hypothetical protein